MSFLFSKEEFKECVIYISVFSQLDLILIH